MTEKEFKNVFKRTGWKVVYKADDKRARVLLKSGQTEIVAGTTWPVTWPVGKALRRMAFRNAALDLSGRPRSDYVGWIFPTWFIGGQPVGLPGWCRDPNTREPCVGSVEEFAAKLSALGF